MAFICMGQNVIQHAPISLFMPTLPIIHVHYVLPLVNNAHPQQIVCPVQQVIWTEVNALLNATNHLISILTLSVRFVLRLVSNATAKLNVSSVNYLIF